MRPSQVAALIATSLIGNACIGEESSSTGYFALWQDDGACPGPEAALARLETLNNPALVRVDRLVASTSFPRMCCYDNHEGCAPSFQPARREMADLPRFQICYLVEEGTACPGVDAFEDSHGSSPCRVAAPQERTDRIRCFYRAQMDYR